MVNQNTKLTAKNDSPAQLIREAVSNNADLEKLKGLMELQERWDANEAKKAYHRAMAEFKANPPKINKDKTVNYASSKGGRINYSHATLANVTEKINTELSKHGLSASWKTQTNGTITVTCKITHVLGHSEETSITAQSDSSGGKNAIQAIGSTITYLERYTLLALLGLATSDQDDDGVNHEKPEGLSEEQLHKIRDSLLALDAQEDKFCAFMGYKTLEEIPRSDFDRAMKEIEAKQRKKAGENANT